MIELRLVHGNPFDSGYQEPNVLGLAFDSARSAFKFSLYRSSGIYPIERDETSISQTLEATLGEAAIVLAPDCEERIYDGEVYESHWKDGLPFNLGDCLVSRFEAIEEEDSIPPMTPVGSGRWLSEDGYYAALALFQLDRATTALAAQDCDALALLIWDTHGLLAAVTSEDASSVLSSFAQMSKESARRNGALGAKERHKSTRALKIWACEQALGVRGADIDIARALAPRIPEELAAASKDPERLIYETLRAKRRDTGRG